jgi:hypothetical protein
LQRTAADRNERDRLRLKILFDFEDAPAKQGDCRIFEFEPVDREPLTEELPKITVYGPNEADDVIESTSHSNPGLTGISIREALVNTAGLGLLIGMGRSPMRGAE